MPFRPTPPQPESKFPPPQQSPQEEAERANKPNEPELLHVQPAVLLDGSPFPQKITHEPKLQEARRLRYVSPDAAEGGDGSLEHPWKDLNTAFCGLLPGDRLLLTPAVYEGTFRVGSDCHAGTAELPIQVFARHAFLKPKGDADVLTVEQPHWQFWEVQIALGHSGVAGFVTRGSQAHDIDVDQSHIYEGRGPAVRISAGSSRIKISNSHIHQATGIRIDAGTRDVTIITSHVHHNFGAAVTIGTAASKDDPPAQEIRLIGNRFQNDHGGALKLLRCRGVQVLHNTIANYRPDEEEGFDGDAVAIDSEAADVVFEDNSVLESTVAIRIGGKEPGGKPPEKIVVQRSFFQNALTSESLALDVRQGRGVRFSNNVVDRYAKGFQAGKEVESLSIANNLFLGARTAFELSAPEAAGFLDYNVFASAPDLAAVISGITRPLSAYAKDRMRHTRIIQGVSLTGSDLGKLAGFTPVDQGKALPGISYRGAAPDIGVAER
jgi:parallel beta helix pectate lyase-like protein